MRELRQKIGDAISEGFRKEDVWEALMVSIFKGDDAVYMMLVY